MSWPTSQSQQGAELGLEILPYPFPACLAIQHLSPLSAPWRPEELLLAGTTTLAFWRCLGFVHSRIVVLAEEHVEEFGFVSDPKGLLFPGTDLPGKT